LRVEALRDGLLGQRGRRAIITLGFAGVRAAGDRGDHDGAVLDLRDSLPSAVRALTRVAAVVVVAFGRRWRSAAL
jgi:hypothetical protein